MRDCIGHPADCLCQPYGTFLQAKRRLAADLLGIVGYIFALMDAAKLPSSEQIGGGRLARRRTLQDHAGRRGPLQQGLGWLDKHADRVALVGLCLAILGSALAMGAVHRPILLTVSGIVAVATFVASRSDSWRWSPLTFVALGLGAYSLLQSLPIPMAWLNWLSPNVAEVWRGVLVPFREPLLSFGSLSLDPGASRTEALKWITYGLVASLAATVERRGPRYSVPLIVVVSAVLIAAVTLVHWLLGAEEVYGWYRPRFSGIISPFINANNLAGYLNLGFFCGLACMLDRELKAPRWLLATFVAGVMAVSALLASRGGLLSLALGLLLFSIGMVARYTRARREMRARDGVLVVSSTILGGVALLWLSMDPGTFKKLLAEGTEKIDLLSWTPALISDNRWFGVGRGAFETAFPPYHGGRGHVLYAHAENFVLQWAAEWGLPVTALALLAFLWLLRPARTNVWKRSASATVAMAVVVLLVHNLVDLALEVPAVTIAVASVLGALTSADPAKTPLFSKSPRWVVPTLVGALLASAFVLTANAAPPAQEQRDALHQSYQTTAWADATQVSTLRAELRSAMLSHPGDTYLPLLGGLAARKSRAGAPLVWASRALERDPRDSRTHLFIAEVLHARRANEQALVHLRFAAQYDSEAADEAARHAVRWSADEYQLLRVVPEGKAGALSFLHLARLVEGTQFAKLKLGLLSEAALRDPDLYDAREIRAWMLVTELGASLEKSLSARRKTIKRLIEQDAAAMQRLHPQKTSSIEVRALMLVSLSRTEEALKLLENGCSASSSLSCHSRWLEVAARLGDEKRLARAAMAFLTASCVGAQGCAEGEQQVAATFASKGRWARALRHYENAAKFHSTTDNWMMVANAAEQVGVDHAEARALRNAAREAGSDAVRKEAIEARYQAIMGEVLQTH